MTTEDLAMELHKICVKHGEETVIHDIDIVYSVHAQHRDNGGMYFFDVLPDNGKKLRVTVTEPME